MSQCCLGALQSEDLFVTTPADGEAQTQAASGNTKPQSLKKDGNRSPSSLCPNYESKQTPSE